ncbi:olfactory receptor 1009-like [Bombina bombina]|uniref:olfactory receptor 1009-like n=1 Tax=Bombina bombina TaxID=8345 RepID=UPI00235AA3CC|nr:olfactory receptor 1009-like [Bombina bombina]
MVQPRDMEETGVHGTCIWLQPAAEERLSEKIYEMNYTTVTTFLLQGFENLHEFKAFIFIVFLLVYLVTLLGNLLIITLVSISHHLHMPMFFFLGHLSFSDVLLTTVIVPNMLYIILEGGGILSVSDCITQFFFYGATATTECLLLTAMSYDRYLAICNPLYYNAIMNFRLCLQLVFYCWLLGFMLTVFTTLCLQSVWFCGPNVIDHFFCDLGPLLELSCTDTSMVKMEVFAVSSLLTIAPFVFITATYVCIFISILKIASIKGRQKTFSTCSSHLAVVCIYYGALFAMYVVPSRGFGLNINKVVSLMYTVVTPLCNPIIYSLRNQEIKSTIRKYVGVKRANI